MIVTKIFIGTIFVENFMLNIFGDLRFFSEVLISRENREKWLGVHVSTPPQEDRVGGRRFYPVILGTKLKNFHQSVPLSGGGQNVNTKSLLRSPLSVSHLRFCTFIPRFGASVMTSVICGPRRAYCTSVNKTWRVRSSCTSSVLGTCRRYWRNLSKKNAKTILVSLEVRIPLQLWNYGRY